MIEIFTLLLSALLFGGMTLYSFGFAPLLFTSLPVDQAGALLRKAFPHYYLFVFVTSAASAASFFLRDPWSAGLMLSVALFAMLARQGLLPLINAARDADRKKTFNRLHTTSVVVNMLQLVAVTIVLVRIA
jgi:Domain of unknown function (DUF4149)